MIPYRLTIEHGDIESDEDLARIRTIERTYHGLIEHGLIEAAALIGTNDSIAFTFEADDPGVLTGLLDVATAMRRSWWRIEARRGGIE